MVLASRHFSKLSLIVKWKAIIAVVLLIPLLVIVALAVVSATARRPKTLGVRDGRLAPCPDSPNCVSTHADRDHLRMDSIPLTTDAAQAVEGLKRVISAMPRSRLVMTDEHYLHAEFTSALFRFVDDVEFFVDREQGVIHFRSASRVGHSDLGVNRERMRAIGDAFQKEMSQRAGAPKIDR